MARCFFASTSQFLSLFDPAHDPLTVTLDCRYLHLADHSAIAALESLYQRYQKSGRSLHVAHLSERNHALLSKAGVVLDLPPAARQIAATAA